MDESIRWLWGQGRKQEALEIAERAARTNDVHFDNKVDLKEDSPKSEDESSLDEGASYGAMDLFKTRNLRRRTFNVAFNWFSNSLVYYGKIVN